jgi:hypothetical protein
LWSRTNTRLFFVGIFDIKMPTFDKYCKFVGINNDP